MRAKKIEAVLSWRQSPIGLIQHKTSGLPLDLVCSLYMDEKNNALLIYCTCPDHEAALKLANTLVDEALAACINIVPGLTSIYRWEGERKTGSEELLMIKTTGEQYPNLEARIKALHPYELPEIIAVPIKAGLPAYLNWIDESCK